VQAAAEKAAAATPLTREGGDYSSAQVQATDLTTDEATPATAKRASAADVSFGARACRNCTLTIDDATRTQCKLCGGCALSELSKRRRV